MHWRWTKIIATILYVHKWSAFVTRQKVYWQSKECDDGTNGTTIGMLQAGESVYDAHSSLEPR